MAKCVRCGKELDIITRDPNKAFYCKKCSEELLGKFSYEYSDKRATKKNKIIEYLIPGLFQFQSGYYLRGILIFLNSIFIPIVWLILFWSEVKYKIINKKIFGINIIFSFFIIINFLIAFTLNIREILNNKKSKTNY
ncbi:hypothetical protein [Haliovirga abyssi]|uniref:DUF2628 domain-containing protein n=1 Tax=Haliovirga abyssi TaxID=2996794 RepID=A0AAU9DUT4_9FUSO|nr:hypothetical protein [Haliovirga abyssi]BDU51009.1 hypothetical protein HLVA_15780 [Haliovirga abyssi]